MAADNLVFELLYEHCIDEGGDGDSALVCEDYVKCAESFESWLGYNKLSSWQRVADEPGLIVFQDGQQGIWFAPNEEKFPKGLHFTIVKIGRI